MNKLDFFEGKKVFLTGHTGFKGGWLTRILLNAGAEVSGYSLPAVTKPNLFSYIENDKRLNTIIGDIRDFDFLQKKINEIRPDIVIHLAAQPLVRDSYKNPRYTYETNVMGTVNILECVREVDSVRSFLNVTTDKVYKNKEWCWGYRENEELDGYDPYSNSKSCSELVTHSYWNSFLKNGKTSVSTARAGNVIGGGDFSKDRIIPDCIRAQIKHEPIIVRNPYSVRPYQHVLEPLIAYLMIVEKQWNNPEVSGSYNVGPNEFDCVTTGKLVDLFCSHWGNGATWLDESEEHAVHEAKYLKLDCSLIKEIIGWTPKWSIDKAVEQTCQWTKVLLNGDDVIREMDEQIYQYLHE